MTDWAQIFTGLLFYAYDGIHQVRRLVFDNYQTCTFPSSEILFDEFDCIVAFIYGSSVSLGFAL